MNPYAIIGILLAFAGLGSYAIWERGNAEHWHEQYSSLQASYQTAAIKAQEDAKAQEQKAAIENQKRADQAVSQAYAAETHAEAIRATYTRKLAQLAGKPNLDLGHACANVKIPGDLIPHDDN